ncbi:MAG: hypothetical protein JNM57_00615 [Cyclobacteriaceae bacterium]|nr:hypothetical protein [Cyclobacteriaceae bacterium]
MRNILFLIAIMASLSGMAQIPADALTKDNKSLPERYYILKSKSQSYNDYKVIKEVLLDGMWRLIMDSVAAQKASIHQAETNIAALQADIEGLKTNLSEKDKVMEDMEHDSTHIDVVGIPFHKATFVSLAGIIIAGLIIGILVVVARLKLQHKSLSEKSLALNALTHEFDDYRHRAMEKQTKLSRELQDERNKLYGLRSS